MAMKNTGEDSKTLNYVAGVSFPRSGHHLLERLLSHYFGEEFRYCEFYGPPNCCKSFPCKKAGTISFSKNHDRQLDLPQRTDVMHVIQYRGFLPTLLSDFELFVRNGGEDSEKGFRCFASKEWSYYRDFCSKWVYSDFASRNYVLCYEDLVSDVISQMSLITALFAPNRAFDEDRMRRIASKLPHITVSKNDEVVTKSSGVVDKRKIESFRYYTPQLFATLGKLRLSRNEVKSTFLRFHNREPREADYLSLQCLESIAELEKTMASIPIK